MLDRVGQGLDNNNRYSMNSINAMDEEDSILDDARSMVESL